MGQARAWLEYAAIFCILLLIGIAAVYVFKVSGSAPLGSASPESRAYWLNTAPIQIHSFRPVYGKMCGMGDTGGYELLLKNANDSPIKITAIMVNGQGRVFCEANAAPADSISIQPGAKKYAGVVISSGAPPCAEGKGKSLGISFSYAIGSLPGVQEGGKSLDFTCESAAAPGRFADAPPGTSTSPDSIALSAAPLPDGAVGSPYSAALSAAGGNAARYRWKLVAGSLPGGLALNASSGAISGVPLEEGSKTFVVMVTDGELAASKSLSVSIGARITGPLSVAAESLPNGTAGVPYLALLSHGGGSGAVAWVVTSGDLPAGLSLLPSGEISGIPESAGESSFNVTVTDGVTSATGQFLISIAQGGS